MAHWAEYGMYTIWFKGDSNPNDKYALSERTL